MRDLTPDSAGETPVGELPGNIRRRRRILLALASAAVCLGAILPYVSTLHGFFLGDDFGLVQLFASKPALHFLKLFTASTAENIWGYRLDDLRPFNVVFYQLSELLGGGSPTGHHATNIALHALNSLLVFGIARAAARLTLPASLFAGLLFAVLPIHAETISWITGRTDAILTVFYLSSFLAYAQWRREGAIWMYCASVALCFLALFSKETALTILPTLVLFDLLVTRRPVRPVGRALRPYIPFFALTAGYLLLRMIVFQHAAREQLVTRTIFDTFLLEQREYLSLLFFHTKPAIAPGSPLFVWSLIGLALAGYVLVLSARSGRVSSRTLLFMGPVWWLLATGPLVVAGYQTPRHIYLASAGVAVMLGIPFDALWRMNRPLIRSLTVLGAAGLLLAYWSQQRPAVEVWNQAAFVSEKILRDVEARAATAPEGALFVLGAPSTTPAGTWLWSWAAPFALRPPYATKDLTAHIAAIVPQPVYCCPPDQWLAETRGLVRRWAVRADRAPVLAFQWDAATGKLLEQSETENPDLRAEVTRLAQSATPDQMKEQLDAILLPLRDDDSILGFLDSPGEGALLEGPLEVIGWSKSVAGDVEVRVILDGGPRAVDAERLPRPDVRRVMPHLGDPSRAGYRARFEAQDDLFTQHSVTVIAHSPGGGFRRFGPVRFYWKR